jgi:heme-degrading monooxygenase HmoA
MTTILAKVPIKDMQQFIGTFSTRSSQMRRLNGNLPSDVFQVAEEENTVWVVFEWESKAAFEGFINDPAVKETMQSTSTVSKPEFIFLEKVANLPS